MTGGRKMLFIAGIILLGVSAAITPVAAAQDDSRGVKSEGRMAVLSGMIVNIDPDDITIQHRGRDITVRTGDLTHGGSGDMNDYFDKGMFVTVEGVLEGKDEIVASRITQGPYYDTIPYNDSSPFLIRPDNP